MSAPKAKTISDPTTAAREQAVLEAAAEQERNDLRTVMATPEGQRVVWKWLAKGRVFAPCFDGSSRTFYREGRREFGLEIMSEVLDVCPELYVQAALQMKAHKTEDDGNGRRRTT